MSLVVDRIKEILAIPVDSFVPESFEPHTTNQARKLVLPGMVCYDVGANEGWYTTLFALLAGPQGLVVAFEPMTGARIEVLSMELKAKYPAAAPVELHRVALTDAAGVGTKRIRRVRTDAWTLQECPEGVVGNREVQYTTLDLLVQGHNLPSPGILKIDVDGDEPKVLQGAVDTIVAAKPIIILEVAPDFNALQGLDITASLVWLQSLGYELRTDQGRAVQPHEAKGLVCKMLSINLICRA